MSTFITFTTLNFINNKFKIMITGIAITVKGTDQAAPNTAPKLRSNVELQG